MVITAFFSRTQSDSADRIRTRVRQRSILRAKHKDESGVKGDENDWTIRYPIEYVEWLADIVEALGLKPSIIDILDTEDQYPGIMEDIATMLWQWRIVNNQVNDGK